MYERSVKRDTSSHHSYSPVSVSQSLMHKVQGSHFHSCKLPGFHLQAKIKFRGTQASSNGNLSQLCFEAPCSVPDVL